MNTIEYDKQDLFVVDFSWNIHNIIDEQDDDNSNHDNFEEIQNEENVEGRGRGRGKGRSRARGRVRNSSSERDNNREQTVQLSPPPFFNTLQHIKPLHDFTINLPKDYFLSLSPYLVFFFFFFLNK